MLLFKCVVISIIRFFTGVNSGCFKTFVVIDYSIFGRRCQCQHFFLTVRGKSVALSFLQQCLSALCVLLSEKERKKDAVEGTTTLCEFPTGMNNVVCLSVCLSNGPGNSSKVCVCNSLILFSNNNNVLLIL